MRFVTASELEKGMKVARDIVFTTQAAILKKNTYLTSNYITFLREKGFLGIYIADELSEEVEIEEIVDPEIFQSAVMAVKNENINTMVDVAWEVVDDVLRKSEISANLIDLRSFDDYTYHHSVNVAVFSVLIGRKLGLVSPDLRDLCLAGLCHDLGKRQVDYEILNKPGRLTDEEFEVIKKHPQRAYDFLSSNPRATSQVKRGVLHHHENEDGSGYPSGIVGKEIPLFAKIIHAADVYDALTSRRAYKNPYEPLDAFFYLEGGKKGMFDPDVVDALMSVIPAYPVGVDVFLANGERALVVGHTKDMLRPKIRLYSTGELVNLETNPTYHNNYILRSGIVPGSETEREVDKLNEDRGKARVKKPTILVCDSSKVSRYHLRDYLDHDYEVVLFENGKDVIDYINNNEKPALIIIEVELPLVDGVTVAKRIRENKSSVIPIIFQSPNTNRDVIMECKMLGHSDYMLKPYNPIYLKETVYDIINNRDFG